MRRLLLWVIALVVLIALLLLWLLQAAISDTPRVSPAAASTSQQVYQVKNLAKRALQAFNQHPKSSSLTISQSELLGLSALAARAYPALQSHFEIEEQGLRLTGTLTLPQNPFGNYLSLQLRLPVSTQQLEFEQLQLGTIKIPDRLLQLLLPWLIDTLLGHDNQQALLQMVRLSATEPDQLTLRIRPPTNAAQQFNQLFNRIRHFSSDQPSIDRSLIRHYYSLLLQQANPLKADQWVSLTYFIAPLFRQVAHEAKPGQSHQHAAAALLALAIYLGNERFEQLTGPVLSNRQRQQRSHYRTLLRGRIDLRQHFVVSAGLQVLADAGFSQAIGEFKELLDSRQGGSGFSFADLAADRAGTLFALRATRNSEQADALLQRFHVPLREPGLMIPVDRLPEELTEMLFQQRYQDLDSDTYRQTIERIDTALSELRLYR